MRCWSKDILNLFIARNFFVMPNDTVLCDKKIILGVSGSIAAYKAVELLRLLVQAGARVNVVMSANAAKFVTPLTFEALSGGTNFFSGTLALYHEGLG